MHVVSPPALSAAVFSYFGQRAASPSGKAIKTLLIDPPTEADSKSPTELNLTPQEHLKTFYQPFINLFTAKSENGSDKIFIPRGDGVTHRKVAYGEIELLIDSHLLKLLKKEDYGEVLFTSKNKVLMTCVGRV